MRPLRWWEWAVVAGMALLALSWAVQAVTTPAPWWERAVRLLVATVLATIAVGKVRMRADGRVDGLRAAPRHRGEGPAAPPDSRTRLVLGWGLGLLAGLAVGYATFLLVDVVLDHRSVARASTDFGGYVVSTGLVLAAWLAVRTWRRRRAARQAADIDSQVGQSIDQS